MTPTNRPYSVFGGSGRVLVRRQGLDAANPFVVGNAVTVYELDEDWPFVELPLHVHDSGELDRVSSKLLSTFGDDGVWRHESTTHCSACPRKGARRAICSIWIHTPSATRWLSPRSEKKPRALRVDGEVTESALMHGDPTQQPCPVAVATCHCGKRWVLAVDRDKVALVGVARWHYDSRIAP